MKDRKTYLGVNILKNPVTGDWFLFMADRDGCLVQPYVGTLAQMKIIVSGYAKLNWLNKFEYYQVEKGV